MSVAAWVVVALLVIAGVYGVIRSRRKGGSGGAAGPDQGDVSRPK